MARHMMVHDEGTTTLPDGWRDELVCHTFRRNRDGTITVIALVNVYSPDGRVFTGERTMRLKAEAK